MHRAGASDSDDDLATTSIYAPARNTRTKATMPKTAAKPATKRKAPATRKARAVLKDRTNIQQDQSDADNVDEDIENPKAKRPKTSAAPKSRSAKKPEIAQAEIPETQPDPVYDEDIEASIEEVAADWRVEKIPTDTQIHDYLQRQRSASVQPLLPILSAQPPAVQPVYPHPMSRSGSVGANDRERRGGDPELRRKIKELTSNNEDLRLKYQALQEIGQNNAESNFERLKRASDQKAKDAQALISSLKQEIAETKKSTSSNTAETTSLQEQITSLTNEKEALRQDLKTQTINLQEKLTTAQNEAKSLEAKLVAARQQLAESKPVPVSTAKTRSMGTNNTIDAPKEAKMKENMYADLTGLIIRGVKRKEGEDEYDCIQTGRNGTLHFHLSVAHENAGSNPRTPSGLSYEDSEFAYEPFLDPNRDRDLLAILPEYLGEDICFPRSDAVKFYTKVVESMTRKIVVDDEES